MAPPLAALLWLTVSCGGAPEAGPGPVDWDRDRCERCAMAVGSRHFATQVRTSRDQRLHLFDDPGCALLWLSESEGWSPSGSGAGEARPEIWVRDEPGERWIDGWTARYRGGQETPMRYGFAPAGDAVSDAVELQEAWRQVQERERERREPRPQ